MSEIKPIIVIGAARSGTKILRDSLAAAAATGVVPYDVGFVWRYGNESSPDDALRPDQVTPRARPFIRRYLARYANRRGEVVEKTVGNTLRVGFVAELLPEARFVYLERDGVDVAVSTEREWSAPTDWGYLARKLRHFPARLVPTYGTKFLRAQTIDRRKGDGHVGTWGPRYPGIDRDLEADGLLRVCARQWRHSVEAATAQLGQLDQPVVSVSYADLTADPAATLATVLEGLSLEVEQSRVAEAASMVDSSAARPARARLTEADRIVLTEELGTILEERGYEQP